MSKEEKLSEKFMIFIGRCNGASLTKFDISKFNDEARVIANEIDKCEKQLAELKAENERLLNENGYLIFADGYDENDNPVHKQIYKTYKESNKELVAENKKFRQQLKEKDEEIARHNEYFNAFACKDFNEFQDFISTFMLTPHEEQTLIRNLENQLKTNTKQVCEKIRKNCTVTMREDRAYYIVGKRFLDQIEKENSFKEI